MNQNSEDAEWRKIKNLLDELQDPFVLMPIQSAVCSLRNSLLEIEENFNERMGSCGVNRKYWDVPTELLHEEKGYLIGNAFVMAQVAVDQAVTIFMRLSKNCKKEITLPKKKDDILMFESEEILSYSLTQIEVINHVANYFKHRHEWEENWHLAKSQNKTILAVQKIGMRPEYFTENMEKALQELDCQNDMNSIVNIVQLWRERLGEKMLLELEKNGFVLPLIPKVKIRKAF